MVWNHGLVNSTKLFTDLKFLPFLPLTCLKFPLAAFIAHRKWVRCSRRCPDDVYTELGKMAERVYDELLCFLGDPIFQIPVRTFMDENCMSEYTYLSSSLSAAVPHVCHCRENNIISVQQHEVVNEPDLTCHTTICWQLGFLLLSVNYLAEFHIHSVNTGLGCIVLCSCLCLFLWTDELDIIGYIVP